MIVVVDYGMGNLRSVSKALESLGAKPCVSADPKIIAGAGKLILPGVGAFEAAMRELGQRGLIAPLKERLAAGVPFLGICLGLQLLFDWSEEGECAGLGILPGKVRRFPAEADGRRLTVPHMGWNEVRRRATSDGRRGQSGDERRATSDKISDARRATSNARPDLLEGIPDGEFFYFVHSYYVEPADAADTVLECDYGLSFTAMAGRGNINAVQFHPEKSQEAGLRLLRNFIAAGRDAAAQTLNR